jgi:hypothetical protein
VRYHYGDDPDGSKGWADLHLDDSSWSVAQQDGWPEPAFYSDGFVWVRLRVPVRSDTAEPLALRISSLNHVLMADEAFVNGKRVGGFGRVPPGQVVESVPKETVFDLSPGLTAPGAIAEVALRIWYPPFARGRLEFDTVAINFDQSRTLHAEENSVRQGALLRNLPLIAINCLILLVGLIVLLLGRKSRSPDLVLYGAMLFTFPWITFFFEVVDARIVTLSVPEQFSLEVISQLPAMVITVEFIWRINRLKDVWFKRLTQVTMVLFNLGILIAFIPEKPSVMVAVALVCYRVCLQAFDVLTLLPNLWVIFVKREKRLVALAMTLVPVASLVSGFRVSYHGGQPNLFDLAFFLCGLGLSATLAHQAWIEWRARDALQAEFEAAREVQDRLVKPASDVPGFQIESVYVPALHVGGDFFYVRPEEQGSVLVVIGDVSGKGLKAALTVSSVIGALRTMPALPPTGILGALNRGLIGQMESGFVTCCAARISQDGKATIANAGHLSPYRNGAEVRLTAGLPLGIDAGAEYEESHFLLDSIDSLTFLSDGIVEARNASGELFGFDRTLHLSKAGAKAIAQAAMDFGQEDDITVLTLTRLSVPYEASTKQQAAMSPALVTGSELK